MKKSVPFLFLFFFILLTIRSNAQLWFEKGYFIDTAGVRTECEIKNLLWSYSPLHFDYRMGEGSSKFRKEAKDVVEFGIGDKVKYVSADVKLDTSVDILEDRLISNNYNPEWKSTRLFMKVVVEGTATLFKYEDHERLRFFFRVKSSPIEQLVHKRYKKTEDANYFYNRNFLNQLFSQVNCKNFRLVKFETIDYTLRSLKAWFQKHNKCLEVAHK